MAAESHPAHSWVHIGTTYGCVVAGRLTALVYHAGAQRGQRGGPAGDQGEAGPGWYLVWVDEPHRHYQLTSPAPRAGAPAAEVDQVALAALAEAGEAVEAKLAGGSSSSPNGR